MKDAFLIFILGLLMGMCIIAAGVDYDVLTPPQPTSISDWKGAALSLEKENDELIDQRNNLIWLYCKNTDQIGACDVPSFQ